MKFPTIKEKQIALLIAEKKTGIVLNNNLDIYREDENNGPVYKVFENLSMVDDYIKILKANRDDLEFVLYDYKQTVVKYICE